MRIDYSKLDVGSSQAAPAVLSWLLEGDPSIRRQVKADLLDEDPGSVESSRQEVAESGWGARLWSCQDPSGTWGGGIYSPKWISTTYTLLTLRALRVLKWWEGEG